MPIYVNICDSTILQNSPSLDMLQSHLYNAFSTSLISYFLQAVNTLWSTQPKPKPQAPAAGDWASVSSSMVEDHML